MSRDLETKLRISQEGADTTSAAVQRVADNLEDVAASSKRAVGKIAVFEEIEAGLSGLEAKLAEATAARDEFLAGAGARKDAIIGAAVSEARAKLETLETKLAEATAARDEFLAGAGARKDAIIGTAVDAARARLADLEASFVEARRKRDYFLDMSGVGDNAVKLFAADLAAAQREVSGLARAIDSQKGTIASLPEALDEQATREATKGLADYERQVAKLGRSVDAARDHVAGLPAAMDDRATREAAKGLERYQKAVETAGKATDKERARLAEMGKQLEAAGVDTRNLAAEKERLAAKSLRAGQGVIALKGQLKAEQEAAAAAAQKTREAGNAAERSGQQAEKGAGGFGGLAGAIKALAAAAVVREFVQVNASMESMTKSLELVTGSSEGAKREMAFVRAEAQRLGLEVQTAAGSYVQLAASAKGTALEGQATREIWSAVAESMARLGKSSADTDGALLAISQMMSKGTVSAEELRGQLGERLPGAFQAAARALGTTTQGLGEMLEQGQIVAEDFLPKFAAELRKTGGGEIDTFNANMSRLGNTVDDVYLTIGEGGAFQALSKALKVAGVAVVAAWEGFELLGKTLGNIGYTIATMDFAGYRDRQREALAEARADVGKVIERLYPLKDGLEDVGAAGAEAGAQIADGQKGAATSTGKMRDATKQLADDFKRLKIDPEEFKSGLTSAERALVESFDRMVAKSDASSDMLLKGFGEAIQDVGIRGLDEFEASIQKAFQAGRVSAEQLEAAMQMVEERRKDLTSGASDLEQAYKDLGIQSQAALDAAAKKAKEAYETIRASGAGVDVLNTAWAKWAEKAIAANGGVADSTIQAEAAMRGYIITVDDAGKAVLRLEKVTEDWAETARQATYAANRALAESATRMSEMYDATRGGIGGLQSSIDDFHAHLAGLGGAMANVINSTRDAVRQATNDSQAALDELQQAIRGVGLENVDSYLRRLWDARNRIIQQYEDQHDAVTRLIERLREGNVQLDRAVWQTDKLDQQTLDNLRAAIADAKRRMEDFAASTRDTVASLRQELAGLKGDYVEAERLQGAQKLAELEAKLQEARASGNKDAVSQLLEAIRLQKEINRLRQQEAGDRQKNDSGGSYTRTGDRTGGVAPGSTTSRFEVVLSLPGYRTSVNVSDESDAIGLRNFFDRLQADMKRAM